MIGNGVSQAEMARALKRTVKAVNNKIHWLGRSQDYRDNYNKRRRVKYKIETHDTRAVVGNLGKTAGRPSHDMLIDRDRRAMAPRSLTAMIFGDPPPGMSALDKRMAGAE